MGLLTGLTGFHDSALGDRVSAFPVDPGSTRFHYNFQNFFHPFVGELIARLNTDSLPGMLDADWQESLKTPDPVGDFFRHFYEPGPLVTVEWFPKEIDVSEHGSYANYNWELLFHVPLTIATQLSKARRFAEAQRWFHYIFDPTSNDQTDDPVKRFWKFLAFRQDGDPKQIDALLRLLSRPAAELGPEELAQQADILQGYEAILDKPFQPHAVARTRHLAYQCSVVMKYLDNLLAWGDDLFQQDTIEALNEATQLYVLASNLLGPRPERVPPLGTVKPTTFAQLKKKGLDAMGNALVELEGQFIFNLGPNGSGGPPDSGSVGPLFGIGRTLYFCIPRNEKLLGYWDALADRLFKIRHCMNIQGVVRSLALFDPPLDPGMLVKASAAGIDLSNVLSGLNQPIGPIRCMAVIQKALELCAEVRGLGNLLLAAMEKGDAEHLALVRQRHEAQIQQMAQEVRFLQWKQAEETTESLLRTRVSALDRYRFYQRVLGLSSTGSDVPDVLSLDRRELTEDNFDEAYAALVEQYHGAVPGQAYSTLTRAPELLSNLVALQLQTGNLHLNLFEFLDINLLAPAALVLRGTSAGIDTTTAALAQFPDEYVDYQYWGVGGHSKIAGGEKIAATTGAASKGLSQLALISEIAASYASKAAGYQRRADDWTLQYNLAADELMQIGRQILGSLIAEQIAHHEYQSLQQQVANVQEIDQFLHDKFTNEELYLWMQGETSRLYYEYYRFAFDTARKAELTMKRELMRPELEAQDFVKFNYWDGGRKGLLSGEALFLDVKRMEMAYHENNKRELELTRHISLRQLDPVALLMLKSTSACTVTVPEWLYDVDFPGHYLRRIKSVALSIPSVVGPYTSLNCTLSLLSSRVRKSPSTGDGYASRGADDDRFIDYRGAVQSIVTSGASVDSGMFEMNLRDERFLPFELAGAESIWKLELPKEYPAFDYATISDVILHIRYTARAGVKVADVSAALHELLAPEGPTVLRLFFSLRHDFPTEWSAFVNGSGDFSATIRRDHFPYFTQGKEITITRFNLYGDDVGAPVAVGDPGAATNELTAGQQFTVAAPPDAHVLTRSKDKEDFLIVEYSL